MDHTEIKEKILTDDTFVSEEIEKILTYYQLKHTLRWTHDSSVFDEKESVAEHVYGMLLLCNYFAPLQENKLDSELMSDLILWHDMAEALVDDMSTLTKTEEHKQSERDAESQLVMSAPDHLQEKLSQMFSIYEARELPEAKFVKAIDKLEPLFQIFFISNKLEFEDNPEKHKATAEIMDNYQLNRLKYIEDYPEIVRFSKELNKKIKETKFIHPEA